MCPGSAAPRGSLREISAGEVRPFIDREYRTLSGSQHTGVGGSSLGGLVSLYLGLKHSRILERLPRSRRPSGGISLWIHRFVSDDCRRAAPKDLA